MLGERTSFERGVMGCCYGVSRQLPSSTSLVVQYTKVTIQEYECGTCRQDFRSLESFRG